MVNSGLKHFFIWLYVVLGAAVVFSLLCISFSLDISLLALPLSLVFSAVMVYYAFTLKKRGSIRAIPVLRKMTQYLPYVMLASFVLRRAGKYGTYYWYDVVTVVLWCIVFAGSLAVSYYMNEKRISSLNEAWSAPSERKQKKTTGSGMVCI